MSVAEVVEQNVVGFHITMHNVFRPQIVERRGHFGANEANAILAKRPLIIQMKSITGSRKSLTNPCLLAKFFFVAKRSCVCCKVCLL